MHEISLCQSVLQVLEEQALAQRFSRVRAVWLEVGILAGVELEALRFGFDVVTEGSLAAQARLEIIEVPATARCPRCAKHVSVQRRFDSCPDCGSCQLRLNGGDELRIKEVEVE